MSNLLRPAETKEGYLPSGMEAGYGVCDFLRTNWATGHIKQAARIKTIAAFITKPARFNVKNIRAFFLFLDMENCASLKIGDISSTMTALPFSGWQIQFGAARHSQT